MAPSHVDRNSETTHHHADSPDLTTFDPDQAAEPGNLFHLYAGQVGSGAQWVESVSHTVHTRAPQGPDRRPAENFPRLRYPHNSHASHASPLCLALLQ